MTTSYTFRKEEFPNLGLAEYLGNWTAVGLDELTTAESDPLLLFISYLGDLEQVDTSNLLLVKAAEGGILKEVYGPCIFQREGQLILKMGANEFPVTQNGANLEVGRLAGALSFDNEPSRVKVKDDEKNEYEVEIFNATVDLMPNPIPEDDAEFFEFRARVNWNAKNWTNKSIIKAKMARGENLAQFISEVPSGQGGDTLKMQDLGEGEFAVTGSKVITGGQYGDSYILELADGRNVWSRGAVATILKTGWEIPKGKPCTLQIANIKQKSDGKYQLDCALRMREPRDASAPKAEKTSTQNGNSSNGKSRAKENGSVAVAVRPVATKQPVSSPAATAVATIPVEEAPDIDTIPWDTGATVEQEIDVDTIPF